MRFAGLNPDELFNELFAENSEKAEVYGASSPEKLQQLYDSLENINFVIHRETDEKSLKNLKETQKYLWERILSTRNAINQAAAPKSVKEVDLVDSLIKGISVTAAALFAIIIFLIIKINHRSKEVEKVTEKLKSLQTEPVKPPSLGGLDPTLFATQFGTRVAPLPQPQPTVFTQVSATPAPEPTRLRKTAKQRVTEAVQRMQAALNNLRKDRTGPTGIRGITKTQIRVPSGNVDETTYDRRSREKKQLLDFAKQGRTVSEIAKWMNLPRDQVETVIRLAKERGEL